MDLIFVSIGIIIIVATFLAYITKILRQPLIPAYILTGLIIGPLFGLITNTELIYSLAEIGIAFLLFVVGLEINFGRLKNVALISSVGGIIQMMTLFSLGFLIAHFMGFIQIEAIYLGLIVAFSSTMVVVKLISDKKELDTLHGRMIVGILLMEDFMAILAISIFSVESLAITLIAVSIIKVIILLFIAFISGKYVLPAVFKFAAKTQELFFLVSLAVCFSFSLLALYLNLSIIIGAFVAGIALANLPYHLEIIGKVKSLKDFFSIIFFVSLGMEITVSSFNIILIPLIVLIIFVTAIKPVITMVICSFFGYKKRPSFLSAISLSQIGEFSLIIVMQGFLLGHISHDILSITILLAVITMTITSYLINFDNTLYRLFSKHISFFEKLSKKENGMEYLPEKIKKDIILCGYNRIGYSILKKLKKIKKTVLVVDYNPETISDLIRRKVPCIYGDLGDLEILERLDMKEAEMLISTLPDITDNELIIQKAKKANPNIIIFTTANQIENALALYNLGADYVIMPHFLGGDHVSLLIEQVSVDINSILKNKLNHIRDLKKRRIIGHEHPIQVK